MVQPRQTVSFLLCVLVLKSYSNAEPKEDGVSPIVQTSLGPVQGFKFISSWTKNPIYAFKGIPFAAPPIGNLRFKLYTDYLFGYSTAVSARVFRERAPVYLYYFAFNGKFKEIFASIIQNKYNFSGVAHAEEMGYIFGEEKVNQEAAEDSNEMITWRRMVRLWTNFAKFGTPTVGNDTVLLDLDWKPVNTMKTKYLLIDENLTMVESDFLAERVALWDSITPSGSSYLHATGLLVALVVTGFIMLNCRTSN